MNTALVWCIYALIIVAAVGITSGVKLLVKKFGSGEMSTLWEYVLSIFSFILAACGSILWLYYGARMDWEAISVFATLAGTATQIVYLILFQSTRKAGLALLNKLLTKREAKIEEEKKRTETEETEIESVDTDYYQQIIDMLKK